MFPVYPGLFYGYHNFKVPNKAVDFMEESRPTPVASAKKRWNYSVWSFLFLMAGLFLLEVSPELLPAFRGKGLTNCL